MIDGFARSAQREQKIRVHRSRPYRKNDQRYVEQKNFTNVRQLFGYGRIDWKKAVPMMSNIYRGNWRLIHNYYFPQQKLISKKRVGSKVIRKMDEPKTPFDRLKPWLEDYRITELDLEKRNTNPISTMKKLKEGIRNIYRYFKDEIMKNEWGKLAV